MLVRVSLALRWVLCVYFAIQTLGGVGFGIYWAATGDFGNVVLALIVVPLTGFIAWRLWPRRTRPALWWR